MAKTSLLISNSDFEKQFQRCCKEYDKLEMFVAWVGDPKNVIPFEYLHHLSKIKAVIGIAFCQTNPDGVQMLIDLNTDLRIAKEKILFHPKIYIFSSQNKKAVFLGSSNFTHQGFYRNHEANVLIEGLSTDKLFLDFEKDVQKWRASDCSFKPNEEWLNQYAERYTKRRQKLKEARLDDEAEKEEETTNSSAWLVSADWDTYLKEVRVGLKRHASKYEENISLKLELFEEYSEQLSIPWDVSYFDTIEKRRMIAGMGHRYGWLGHVGASGKVRQLLASGTKLQHKTIVNSINGIAGLSIPLDWNKLKKHLNNLVALGPTMKVWGRLLAIVRPDLFCTISSPQVRKKIAMKLDRPEKYFEEVEGYLALLRLIHSSPWFNSKEPIKKNEIEIWKRRVAFLDVVLYE